jgi:peptidoglycan/LPS O-acetylase OafA/YrhL
MGFIRLLLALAVFNSHFPLVEDVSIVDGHEAVLAFFAISGFYMALVLDTAYRSARDFYAARFLAIYPMYVFALIICVGLVTTLDVHPLTSAAEMRAFLSDPAALLLTLWTSVALVGQELFFSLGQAADHTLHFVSADRVTIWRNAPMVQAWSLSLEAVFYALAPFLVRLRTRNLLLLVAAGLSLKLCLFFGPARDFPFFLRFFPAEFWLFGSGILAYRAYALLPEGGSGAGVFALITLMGLILCANDVHEGLEPFFLPLAALVALPFIFRTFRRSALDRLAGKLSYPFYLLHFTAIALFEQYEEEPSAWHMLAAALVAAACTHALFSPGIEALKRKIRSRQGLTLPAPDAVPVTPAPRP